MQSVVNKCDDKVDVVREVDFDAFVITETWLPGKDSDQKVISDMTHDGCSFHNAPRTHRKGLRDSINFKQHPCFQSSSFENYYLILTSGGVAVRVTVVYRLHQTKKNGLKSSDSFGEFSEFVDSLDISKALFCW